MTFGHPYMIAVEDCDACLPRSGSAVDIYMSQLVRLSLLIGRINRTIYGYVVFTGHSLVEIS